MCILAKPWAEVSEAVAMTHPRKKVFCFVSFWKPVMTSPPPPLQAKTWRKKADLGTNRVEIIQKMIPKVSNGLKLYFFCEHRCVSFCW